MPETGSLIAKSLSLRGALLGVLIGFFVGCAPADVPDRAMRSQEPVILESGPLVEQVEAALRRTRSGLPPGRPLSLSLLDLTTPEMETRLGIRLLKIRSEEWWCESFLIAAGEVHPLTPGFGGFGLHSALVTDLDRDGSPELTCTTSWGSGIHRSEILVFRLAEGELLREEVPLAFRGDLFLRPEGRGGARVEIGEWTELDRHWEPEAVLGVLAAEPDGALLHPRVRLAELTEEQRARLWEL
jgi:hypothetical protein